MKKLIAFLLILAVLIAIFFIAISINSPKNNGNSETNAKENQDNEITGDIIKEDSGNNQIRISGNSVDNGTGNAGNVSGGNDSGSSGDNSEISENNPEERELPSDLNTRPCGSYFLEYNVCAGVCPDGKCLVDGKSCYCRIV